MELKDNILSIWKAKDKCKTSSLRPMFVLFLVRSSEKKSTSGDTFSPSSATECFLPPESHGPTTPGRQG